MIKALEINHICLWVRSLSESRDYYEKLFNFNCKYRDSDQVVLIVESEDVNFFMSECRIDDEFLEKQHIAFSVKSIADVVENLKSVGVTEYDLGEVDCFNHNNYKWCEWRDPSGIRLECVEIL